MAFTDYSVYSADASKLTEDYFLSMSPVVVQSETAETSDKATEYLSVIERKPVEELPGDYWEHGELICGKCHTPKSMNHGEVAVTCKCFQVEEDKQRERDALAQRKERCFQNVKLRNCTFDKLDMDSESRLAITAAEVYCEDWDCMRANGGGIVFCGNTGTGKTSVAAAIANEIMRMGFSARMVRVSDILVKADDKGDFAAYVEDMCKPALLILDDYGSSRATEFALEKLLNFVDHRRDTGKPMIVTTNLSVTDLKKEDRIHSRIVDGNALIQVVGRDRRRENGFFTQTRLETLIKAKTNR